MCDIYPPIDSHFRPKASNFFTVYVQFQEKHYTFEILN